MSALRTILGLVLAMSLSTFAMAANEQKCSTEGGTMSCRDLAADDIGTSWCISRKYEARAIRKVLRNEAWVTNKIVALEILPHAPNNCVVQPVFEFKDQVNVEQDQQGKLWLSITSEKGRLIVNKAPLTVDPSKLWLTTTVGSSAFFLYVKDEPAGPTPLEKYLLIEAFDVSRPACAAEQPKVGNGGNVHQRDPQQKQCAPTGSEEELRVAKHKQQEADRARPQRSNDDGEVKRLETGVGGGGEDD